jgi:hypothetical protein
MELTEIIRTLWERKVALAIVVGLALLAGLSTVYRISPSGLSSRSYEFGAAQAQLLVDSPRSSLLDLTQETPPLAERAAVYAQFMRSNAIKAAIAEEAGIPVNQVTTEGPYTAAGATQNIPRPAETRSNEIRGEGKLYRLVFDYQPDLPVISIYAQAPTEEAAVKLASGTVKGVSEYVSKLEDESAVPEQARTHIRELGPAEGGTVNSGVDPLVMLLAFMATLLAGCGVIVGAVALRRGLRQAAVAARAPAEQANPLDGLSLDPTVLAIDSEESTTARRRRARRAAS